MRAHGLLLSLLPLAACESFAPLEDFSCGDDDGIALDSALESLGSEAVAVTGGFVDAAGARIDLADDGAGGVREPNRATLRFPITAGRAALLPVVDASLVRTASALEGFGEGESMAIFTLVGVVSVGRLNSVDDVDSGDQHDRLRLVAVDDDAVCVDGGRAAAAVSLRHDGGTTTHLPGETADVVIDGAPHTLIVGAASHREFDGPLPGEPCADCPSPGRHVDVGVDVVLYRVAD